MKPNTCSRDEVLHRLHRVTGCTRAGVELKAYNIDETMKNHKQKLKEHVERVNDERLAKQDEKWDERRDDSQALEDGRQEPIPPLGITLVISFKFQLLFI